jgi:hypothetical protein
LLRRRAEGEAFDLNNGICGGPNNIHRRIGLKPDLVFGGAQKFAREHAAIAQSQNIGLGYGQTDQPNQKQQDGQRRAKRRAFERLHERNSFSTEGAIAVPRGAGSAVRVDSSDFAGSA